jgi:hypothetical protein
LGAQTLSAGRTKLLTRYLLALLTSNWSQSHPLYLSLFDSMCVFNSSTNHHIHGSTQVISTHVPMFCLAVGTDL